MIRKRMQPKRRNKKIIINEEDDLKIEMEICKVKQEPGVGETTSSFRMQDLCRICAQKEDGMIAVFGNIGKNRQLQHKINTCLPIKVNEGDLLPLHLCERCMTRVEDSYDLNTTCQQADTALIAMLSSQQNEDTRDAYSPIEVSRFMKVEEDDWANDPSSSDEDLFGPPQVTDSRAKRKSPRQALSRLKTYNEDRASDDPKDPDFIPSESEVVDANFSLNFAKRCEDCGESGDIFYKFEKYKNHMVKRHQIYVCETHPDYRGASSEEYTLHRKECAKYLCFTCGKTFNVEYLYSNHLKLHQEKTLSCETCGLTFFLPEQLRKHRGVHATERNFKCSVCHKKYKYERNVKVHEEVAHSNNWTFECNICSLVLPSLSEINEHCCKHSTEEKSKLNYELFVKKSPFFCPACDKYYATKIHLKNHVYKCHSLFENIKAARKSYYIKKHTKKFECDFCKNLYSPKYYLRIHMAQHLGTRENPCNQCSKSFNHKKELEDHVKAVHLGQLVFPCRICNKPFKCKRNLGWHMGTVHNKNDYICQICGKNYKRAYALRIHQRTHTNERPYSCKICLKSFKQSGDRNKHERTQHPNQ